MLLAAFLLGSCARMGQPDGGWYDETPPRIMGAAPADKGTNVKNRKISIFFDEFIQIENATEKVVVSPPQLETPEIVASGKRIRIELLDSLKPNTTYTIDFSDAITDNNENNPLGNYTYSFSTGDAIDTLEVSGKVLQAKDLEPVKGILVGLYSDLSDTAFTTKPMLRVSRTDGSGRFVIKGVAPGTYRVYALQDADGNYLFNQKSEMLAFSQEKIVPSFKPDVRQDTTWIDSLRIKSIDRVGYTHFLPDDIVLRAFNEVMTDRYFLKAERREPESFTLFYSYGGEMPQVRGLNFQSDDAFIIESTEKQDTITYWLKDTALVNQDTLRVELTYHMTDSLGKLVEQIDTLDILSRISHEKRQKDLEREREEWQKKQDRAKKRGEPYDSIMPPKALAIGVKAPSELDPDKNIPFTFNTPLASVDTAAIHLYSKHDTLWYNAPLEFNHVRGREYELRGEWRPDIEYSLEIDSAAFVDIYGKVSPPFKQGFKVKSFDEYGTLLLNIPTMTDTTIVVQLLDAGDKIIKEVTTNQGVAEFYYVSPSTYYVRMYIDSNRNGEWDTGLYSANRQPETVCYFPKEIEIRAKWDFTETWNPLATPVIQQKPAAVTKQKPDKDKKIKNQNARRAEQLGIEYIPQTSFP
ncbi:MAG: Ig-like domain-containing protein [Prevotella sp.]|nr:Ig-like domain-containing protein [Prevotella sp.]